MSATVGKKSVAKSSAATGEDRYDTLRAERDRFVALAFCNADLLVELDAGGRIMFVCGATKLLLGRKPEKLKGHALADIVAPTDRSVVARLVRRAKSGGRLDTMRIKLAGINGPTPPVTLSGYSLADMGGQMYLAVRVEAAAPTPYAEVEFKRDKASGILDRESFSGAADAAMRAANDHGEEVELTLIQLGDWEGLESRLEDEARDELLSNIGACLRASSVTGDAAGRLDGQRYGLVHRLGADVDAIVHEIDECARRMDPSGVGAAVSNATVAMDATDDGADAAKLLRYTINKYCEKSDAEFSINSLSEGLSALTDETVERMTHFGRMVAQSEFRVAFQPICDLHTLRPHHFEALVRFGNTSIETSPYELITFAEEVGLIGEFDLAMCAKVMEMVAKLEAGGHKYMVAVNLSSRSLSSPSFIGQLHNLLHEHESIRKSILFEITESAKISDLSVINDAMQSLRKAGHILCLDDLGAGEAAFRYLSALDVDVVKIDGAYMKKAMQSPKGKALLKAMVGLCRELDVVAVSEWVEDEAHAEMARECGIRYGQGYYLGRPSEQIDGFDSPRPAAFARK